MKTEVQNKSPLAAAAAALQPRLGRIRAAVRSGDKTAKLDDIAKKLGTKTSLTHDERSNLYKLCKKIPNLTSVNASKLQLQISKHLADIDGAALDGIRSSLNTGQTLNGDAVALLKAIGHSPHLVHRMTAHELLQTHMEHAFHRVKNAASAPGSQPARPSRQNSLARSDSFASARIDLPELPDEIFPSDDKP